MKKVLAILLALTLIFTFAACGDDDSKRSDKDSGNSLGEITSNTYETPIQMLEMYANKKEYFDMIDAYLKLLNGFCEDETEALMTYLTPTKSYTDSIEENKKDFEDDLAEKIEKYGSDFVCTYTITDKEKVNADKLESLENSFDSLVSIYDELIEKMEDADEDVWEDLAEELNFSVSKTKELVGIVQDIRNGLEGTEVDEAYDLTVEVKYEGDESEIEEQEISVIKVNGRWTCTSALFVFAMFANINYFS